MILSIWSRDFFQKYFLVNKFCTVLLPNLLRPKVNFMAFLNIDISTKKLQTMQAVPGKVTWSNSWRHYLTEYR